MSKPMLVTLPCLMLLLDFWPLRRAPTSRAWLVLGLEKAPFFLLAFISCVITARVQEFAMSSILRLPLDRRMRENAVVAYTEYLAKAVWPANLGLPYLHPGGWPLLRVAGAAFVIIGFSFVAFFMRAKRPFLFTGWFWFLGDARPGHRRRPG